MGDQTTFDAIVVGGGPAGSAAAYEIANAGKTVLLVEKKSFPRDKPCGGGLTVKTLKLYPFSIGEVIERATNELLIGRGLDRVELFDAPSTVCTFAVRSKLDRFCLDRAIDAGAEFEVASISDISQSESGVTLTLQGSRRVEAKYLIGADGATSQVRRECFPTLPNRRGFALEGLLPYSKLPSQPKAEFDFGWIKGGYGWVFPKGDHANVGIYTHDEDVKLSKDQLFDYSNRRLGNAELENVIGGAIPFGGARYRPQGRIVLAGDAAGMAEPLLGEGIHNAVKSGQAAGRAVIMALRSQRSFAAGYSLGLIDIRLDLERCHRAAEQFFYPQVDGMGYGALKFPITKMALMRGFAAGKTLYEITNTFFLAPLYPTCFPDSLRDFELKNASSVLGE